MFLPFLIGILIPFSGVVSWTHRVFYGVYERERKQIAVDNSGIALGRGDRTLFRGVRIGNQFLSTLELVHHPLHLCARTPQGAAACAEKDAAIEAEIALEHHRIGHLAARGWEVSRWMAAQEASRLGEPSIRIERRRKVPLVALRCPVCGQLNRWELESGARPVRSRISAQGPTQEAAAVSMVGESLLGGREWDYVLEP